MKELPVDDDGFEWSLRMARRSCLALYGLLALFWAAAGALQFAPGSPQEQPVLFAALAIIAAIVVATAPLLRDRVTRIGIEEHLARSRDLRRPRQVYATFATATATGVFVAQMPALCGFVATAMSHSLLPLAVGTLVTGGMWVALWPSRRLWERWTWQALLRLDDSDTIPVSPPTG